ncbi:HAD family hydrolase [Kiritimatiellota bacterium B12222]|nr:HAD family hydrolase [Kiritimatiellota bacterium B12222]
MMNKAKTMAALFDLDGTLVDSLQDIAASMNEVLVNRGFSPHPVEPYRVFVGDGMDMLVRRVLPKEVDVSSSLLRDMIQDMKLAYARHWREHAFAYEGIKELLVSLGEQGYLLGVLSNKPEAFTREMVSYVFPDINFNIVRGARTQVPIKPDPAGAHAILKEWGLEPEQVLYVGDTNTDMQTGKNTGMYTVGVTWGFRDREELESNGADDVVDHPQEISDRILGV